MVALGKGPLASYRYCSYTCTKYKMCGSRKYPYPHHRGNFTPADLPGFSIFIENWWALQPDSEILTSVADCRLAKTKNIVTKVMSSTTLSHSPSSNKMKRYSLEVRLIFPCKLHGHHSQRSCLLAVLLMLKEQNNICWYHEHTYVTAISLQHKWNKTLVKSVYRTVPNSLFWAPTCVAGFEHMPLLAC